VRAELNGTGGWVPADSRATQGRWALSLAAGGYAGTDQLGVAVAPRVARATGTLTMQRGLAGDRAVVSVTQAAAGGGRDLPPQWLAIAGGPWSAPGYDAAAFATRAYLSQRLEVRQPIPAPAIPLGRYGKAPGHVTLAPYAQVLVTASGISAMPSREAGAWPSAGMGVLFFFDLLRFDVARGLRDGAWRFAIDIDRSFWGVL
jgi:hypothetical protein